MAETRSFQDLLARVRQGDREAAAELVAGHEPRVRRAVRRYLATSSLRRLVDSTDISQSVFGRFFPRLSNGTYAPADEGQVGKILVTMARNKFRDHARKQQTVRRGGGAALAAEECLAQVPAADGTPSQIVSRRELLEAVHARLSAEERSLAEQRAEGQEWAEIAAQRGTHAEALRKRLARAAQRVAQELDLGTTSA